MNRRERNRCASARNSEPRPSGAGSAGSATSSGSSTVGVVVMTAPG